MKTTSIYIFAAVLLLLAGSAVVFGFKDDSSSVYSNPAITLTQFVYSFNVPGILEEKGTELESTSPYWWLNSGGIFVVNDGVGSTNLGKLNIFNPWRLAYARSSATDTEGGYYPQNLFRLITRTRWQNFREQAYFKIIALNMTDSENRNESNGLLLFSRYVNSDNLYYMGVRVDGTAVIKKKQNGVYHTLAQIKIFDGEYDRSISPNLLPINKWIGVASEVQDIQNGVKLTLYVDIDDNGNWKEVLSINDQDSPITARASAGIRTDFMDVLFKDFVIATL
jgi:hypothetical protein